MVRADATQVEQVVINLAANARDAMPDGGLMTIETCNVDFTVADVEQRHEIRPGPYVRLAVTDTGAGFDPQIKVSLFDPFFTTKVKGKGTGLGLATVYGVVKQSGGYIYASSTPGRGATFEVFLPAVGISEKPLRDPLEVRTESQLGGQETILLVEDEEPLRAMACAVLEDYGYTVLQAADGNEALQVSNRYDGVIDILVTDIVMPKIGGRQVAEQLTAARKGLRVLFMTGYTDDADLCRELLEGGIEVLQKPFSPTELVRRIQHARAIVSETAPAS
jgi:two-component system, cell cycle sensor histidine kinase and response regulator CckA